MSPPASYDEPLVLLQAVAVVVKTADQDQLGVDLLGIKQLLRISQERESDDEVVPSCGTRSTTTDRLRGLPTRPRPPSGQSHW
uniref:Uncharacterized protein n=1 Tax=Panagrellus redivivus TaxID=6233 RepID=A0A7E4UP60_PANRE